MISMLILAIVCIAWLQIICIQSARKEARRREAVERLAGMMDAFMYTKKNERSVVGTHLMKREADRIYFDKMDDNNIVASVFDGDVSPIGYQIFVYEKEDMPDKSLFWGWDPPPRGSNPLWLVGRLYDRCDCTVKDAGKPFFTLSVCLGL